MKTPDAKARIDDNNSRYRFCCCHVRIWAMIIGIIEQALLIANLICGIANYTTGRGWQGGSYDEPIGISGLVGGILGCVVGFIVVGLLIYGLRQERPGFLIPHIVAQVIAIFCLFVTAIVYFALAAKDKLGNKRQLTAEDKAILTAGGVGIMISAGIETVFFYVIVRAYRYLEDKRFFGGRASMA